VINPVTQYDQYVFACNGYDLDNRNEGIVGRLRLYVKGKTEG